MPESQETAHYFSDASLCDEQIEEVDVTYGFVVDKLIQGWPKFHQTAEKGVIKSVTLEKTTSIGCKPNMIRFIATLTTDEVLSAVIKVTSSMTCSIPGMPAAKPKEVSEKRDKDISEAQRKLHDGEAEFYQRFSGESAIPGFPIHEIYYSRKFSDNQTEDAYIPPMLILEDLTQVTHTVMKELAEDQVKSIVKGFASLHKHILCMKDEKWKDFLTGMNSDKMLMEKMAPSVDKGIEYFGDIYRRLHRVMTGEFINYATNDFSLQIGLPEMLVHGFNPANVLFSNAEPSSIAAFADFQLVFLGSPAIDLERVITLASHKYKDDPEARSKFETDNFAYYYEVLSRKMAEEGHELTFTPEQLKRSYQLSKVICAARNMAIYANSIKHLPQMPGAISEEHMKGWQDYVVAGGNEAVQILQQEAPEWLDE
ncbi:ecdysteroid kinase domain-containing protein [Ditylenchus destructor]|uniref:Ecdysteroid kinase domain-containing protein n=1 Tax=Ditylenchus destructor TaxID=166010 RepID=A0AAD4QZ00_9BILA|nr:ecdysteroid kinase domain-containing protein [Ditylenchus destructor]